MSLRDYARKRRFDDTPEPQDSQRAKSRARGGHRPIFVVQLHAARARHYDFRLEVDGALKSWAVPKGPSLRAGEKRLAVEVEDHPLAYATFEGEIPEGNYGAGHVLVFDRGVWSSKGDPLAAIAAGKLEFELEGGKLRGGWKLVRTGMQGGRGAGKPQWLLIKRDDAHARDADADDLVEVEPGPASSGALGRTWISGEGERAVEARPAKARAATKRASRRNRRADSAWAKRASAIPGAKRGPFPAGFRPQLATLREHAPRGDDWLHEVKWDGYRMLADLVGGKARLRSRNDLDWTPDFPGIVAALESLPVSDARIDGELVALDANGVSDFALLQRMLQGRSVAALRYVAFDLPGVAGIDLSNSPLLARKQLLHDLLAKLEGGPIVYSQHVVGHGEEVFAASAGQGLEGILSKRVDAHYVQARSADWVKAKHAQSDEFVVVGYTAPRKSRVGFGSLLMATRGEDGGLRYAGRVGTGYDDDTLRALHRKMQPLRRKTPTVELPPHLPHDKRDRGNIAWLEPRLVAEVAYRGFGKDGLLRQASFQRLRIDKTAGEVGMQHVASKRATSKRTASGQSPAAKPRKASQAKAGGGVEISSRERVVFPDSGITKGEVADYYEAIAKWILPGLGNRPLSLLRCPDGAGGQCFFQKHHAESLGDSVRAISLQQKSGREDYLYVRDARGLLELVQMNTLEFHPWGSRVDKPEQPDTLVFDLDPGPGVAWKDVVAGAREVRARLRETGLESFVRLSGGKGVHVVAPIRRGPSWDAVRDFTGAFAEAMAAHRPLRYVATMSKAKREGRIFIDWLRNGRGATSVCNWSLRARAGAPVAMPIRWEELGRSGRADAYDLRKALRRAATLEQDPWTGFHACKQSLPG